MLPSTSISSPCITSLYQTPKGDDAKTSFAASPMMAQCVALYLRGRVRVRNLQDGTTYTSQQLYWDNEKHEFYSNVPMHIVTPDRDLQGDRFRSDEQLTRYEVRRTRGFIPMPSSMSSNSSGSTTPDTTNTAQ